MFWATGWPVSGSMSAVKSGAVWLEGVGSGPVLEATSVLTSWLELFL